MKNFYYLLLAFSLILPYSCNKNGGMENNIKMADPATKDVAAVVTFSGEKTPSLLVKDTPVDIKKIEFTEASRFIMTYAPTASKAITNEEVSVGSFTYQNGVYNLSGVGSVKTNGNSVTFTPASGEAQTVTATVTTSQAASDYHFNASRTWKVNSVIVGLVGGSYNLQRKFSGCDLEEISVYAKKNGVPFSEENMNSFKGLKVDEVIFTASDTFVISFVNGVCYRGTFKITPNMDFSYNLVEGNDLLNVSANGSIAFPADSKCTLVISTTAKHLWNTYTGTIEFDLTEQK